MSALVAVPMGTEIEYPEGPKVPEGNIQTRRRTELLVALERWLKDRPDALVFSDTNIYYRKGDPTVVVAPDLAVAFGVNREDWEDEPTYRVWEAGAAPAFALEIASHTTYKRDLRAKPERFADLGVQEYWRLDPTDGEYFTPPLAGEHRRSGVWEPIPVSRDRDGSLTAHSAALGLDLHWHPPKLRLHDPTTRAWLLDAEDLDTARQAAEARAAAETAARQAAEARAAAETAARQAAERRAAAAEAELAALRQQPHHPPA